MIADWTRTALSFLSRLRVVVPAGHTANRYDVDRKCQPHGQYHAPV